MNDKERFNIVRAEVKRLQLLREHMRKQELTFKDMRENGYEESDKFISCTEKPEYKLERLYYWLGSQLASKLDDLLTFIEEHDTNK